MVLLQCLKNTISQTQNLGLQLLELLSELLPNTSVPLMPYLTDVGLSVTEARRWLNMWSIIGYRPNVRDDQD